MPTRVPEAPEQPSDFNAAYAELAGHMRELHIVRIAEMPRIELYLDQLIAIVGMELSFMYAPGEKIVTGSMVNNYVKQRLLPPPRRKRYTRRHLASLLFVCAFKRVLSIAQISQLRSLCDAADVNVERAYDELADTLEGALSARFALPPATPVPPDPHVGLVDGNGDPVVGELGQLMGVSVALLADKIYFERVLALEARQEA